jgi:RNA polymerase sigma-70 factor (ECF subfamily)
MATEEELITACKEFNPAGQKLLYYKFAPKMKGVCIRYSSNSEEAKDILQESFLKVFSKIHSFSNSGSLEGWIRRIVINTAINHYNKNKKYIHENIETHIYSNTLNPEDEEVESLERDSTEEECIFSNFDFSQNELIHAINVLPEQYKLVFNLFYMEDTSHKDISELLSIEENTSRTRLYRAKKILQKYLLGLRTSSSKGVLNRASDL